MARSSERSNRLVLVPLPLQGHLSPMLQLATVLHSKNFSITIVHTHFNSPNPSNYPDFNFEFIKTNGFSDEKAASQNWVSVVSTLNITCQAPFQNCLIRLMEHNPHEKIVCIISDATMYFTQTVANHLKLPRFVLRTSSASAFLTITSPISESKGDNLSLDSSLQALVPELHPLTDNKKPELNIGNSKSFTENIKKGFEAMKISSGIIWNTFEYIEESELEEIQRVLQVQNFTIGPLHKLSGVSIGNSLLMEDKNCITWLEKQAPKSVIYVSFGSLAVMEEEEFVEIALGLANSEQPFLWVVRPGSVHGSQWIEPLPDGFEEMTSKRGKIVKWAPQNDVLAHPSVGGFWTHNGWNSTLESLCEGVPMICRPCFADQMLNAKYVTSIWKVGLQVEKDLKREDIERVIRKLMIEKEGEEMRQRAATIKENAEVCLRKGGSSHKSLEKLVNFMLS